MMMAVMPGTVDADVVDQRLFYVVVLCAPAGRRFLAPMPHRTAARLRDADLFTSRTSALFARQRDVDLHPQDHAPRRVYRVTIEEVQ